MFVKKMICKNSKKRWCRPVGFMLLFLVSFLFFDRIVFLGLRSAAFHYYNKLSVSQDKLRIGLQTKKPQGLVFGTSRAEMAINKKILSQILSLRIHSEAQAGTYPAYNQLYFQRLRAYLGEVRFVIYGMDYFMFDKKSSQKDMARLEKVSQKEVLNPEVTTNYPPFSFARFSMLYRFKPELDEFFNDFLGQNLKNGKNAAKPLLKKKKRIKKKKLRRQPPSYWKQRAYRCFPGVEGQYLLALLQELSARGIVTFLVLLPDFIGTNATNFEQEAFKKDVRALAVRFHSTVVLDFNTAEQFRLDDPRMFSDGGWGWSNSHLSDVGSRIISSKIAYAIKSYFRTQQIHKNQ
jgi:hypothetical protein